MDISTWIALGGFIVTILGGVVVIVRNDARQQTMQENMNVAIAGLQNIPDRVLTLEHGQASMVQTRATLKEQNDREHESIRSDLRQARDRFHDLANIVNNVNLNLELIKQFISDLKEERKAERERAA